MQPNGEGHKVSYADYRNYRDKLKLSPLSLPIAITHTEILAGRVHSRRGPGKIGGKPRSPVSESHPGST